MARQVIKISLIAFLVFILVGLGNQIFSALNAGTRLDREIEETGRLQQENKELKNELAKVESKDYIESVARDKLNMAKPDETVVIIPKETIQKIADAKKPQEEPKLPNWQGWLNLFF